MNSSQTSAFDVVVLATLSTLVLFGGIRLQKNWALGCLSQPLDVFLLIANETGISSKIVILRAERVVLSIGAINKMAAVILRRAILSLRRNLNPSRN